MITHEAVRRLLSESLQLQLPTGGVDLLHLLDSLSFVELLLALEQECGLELTNGDFDFDSFRTVDCIVEFVNAQARGTTGLETRSA